MKNLAYNVLNFVMNVKFRINVLNVKLDLTYMKEVVYMNVLILNSLMILKELVMPVPNMFIKMNVLQNVLKEVMLTMMRRNVYLAMKNA